jgi:mRNA interferase MazF
VVIRQGDVFWIELDDPTASEPGYRHPHVVVQNDVYNQSRLGTVVVCALTSNLKRAEIPGNVLLEAGEGNLPKQSVVNVSQISAVDKGQLAEWIGALTPQRVREIVEGIRLLLEPRAID